MATSDAKEAFDALWVDLVRDWQRMQEEFVFGFLVGIIPVRVLRDLICGYHDSSTPVRIDLLMGRCCDNDPILMGQATLGVSTVTADGTIVATSPYLQRFQIAVQAAAVGCHSSHRFRSPSICPLAVELSIEEWLHRTLYEDQTEDRKADVRNGGGFNDVFSSIFRGEYGHLKTYEVRLEPEKSLKFEPKRFDDENDDKNKALNWDINRLGGWHLGQEYHCDCTSELFLRFNPAMSAAYVSLSPFLAHDQISTIVALASHYETFDAVQ